ncbi:TPA: DUF4158 domain-containing protein, partial [Legionella pneumophila]
MYSPNRINLLSDQEIEAIYAIPEFNKAERELYFSLTDEDMLIVKKYRTTKAQIYFIRLLGYFKAKQQFYKFNLGQDNDSQFILGKYFEEHLQGLTGQIDFKTYSKQKTDILLLFSFKDWQPMYGPKIQLHLSELIKLYPKGHDALRQLLNYFSNQQIVLPSYRTIQDMFTNAYSMEDARLDELISVIPESKKEQLSVLINKEDG